MAELSETVAIVLAAGAGTRMGAPKALMTVSDEPWWSIQSNRLRGIGVRSLWVVSDAVSAAIPPGETDRRCLADPGAPMFASLRAGCRALTAEAPRGVFVLPIDVPAPGAALWRDLAATDAVAVPMVNDRGGHPVYLPWDWADANILAPGIDPSAARLDTLIEEVALRVPTDDPDAATNCNTPGDLDRWLERNRSSP